ncbi:MAG: MBL fold metallo-hydrolase [Candidatus Saccharibacteria bacterium]
MNNQLLFDISFKWIGGPTWIMRVGDMKIACDPVLCPEGTVQNYGYGMSGKRLTAPQFNKDEFKDVDIWLISHEHEDHIDKPGLSQINPQSICITNKKAAAILSKIHPQKLKILRQTQKSSFQVKGFSVEIEAIPAVHASNALASFVAGKGNGYWLKISKGGGPDFTIYITGDTICHDKVTKQLKNRKVDILIPNMGEAHKNKFGGPYTLSAKSLKDLMDITRPELVIPVHHSSFSHMSCEPISVVADWHDERVKILTEGESFTVPGC